MVSRYVTPFMTTARPVPMPWGGGLSYAASAKPGNHDQVEGSALMAAKTASGAASSSHSNSKRTIAVSRKSSSTGRNGWSGVLTVVAIGSASSE